MPEGISMIENFIKTSDTPNASATARTTYHEETIGKTHYCVTNVYLGKADIKKILEDSIIRNVLRESAK